MDEGVKRWVRVGVRVEVRIRVGVKVEVRVRVIKLGLELRPVFCDFSIPIFDGIFVIPIPIGMRFVVVIPTRRGDASLVEGLGLGLGLGSGSGLGLGLGSGFRVGVKG